MRLTFKHHFDAAHRLMTYDGPCKNLHGHRYLVEFQLEGTVDPFTGMMVDFKIIKQTLGKWLDIYWDHGVILNELDREIANLVDNLGLKRYVAVGTDPTAEWMAEHLLSQCEPLLCAENISWAKVTQVRVWETPDCSAVATDEGGA